MDTLATQEAAAATPAECDGVVVPWSAATPSPRLVETSPGGKAGDGGKALSSGEGTPGAMLLAAISSDAPFGSEGGFRPPSAMASAIELHDDPADDDDVDAVGVGMESREALEAHPSAAVGLPEGSVHTMIGTTVSSGGAGDGGNALESGDGTPGAMPHDDPPTVDAGGAFWCPARGTASKGSDAPRTLGAPTAAAGLSDGSAVRILGSG